MNIIVTNKYKDLLNSANIEILKELNGVFQVKEIANSFNSIFYKKLIIDATALDRFPKDDVLRELAKTFDTEKLILFLPPDNPPPKQFLSFLISINIYNFTDNIKGLIELINKSNSYENVQSFVTEPVSARPVDNELDFSQGAAEMSNGHIILGIKNVTKNAGSTELTYLLKRALSEVHNRSVVALELDKSDFTFYNYRDMHSIDSSKLGEFLTAMRNQDVIIVDLADGKNANICTDVIYLVQPSMYRVNQLMMGNRTAFAELKGKKVVLYNSLLSEHDINTFAKEAGISIYFNLPPLNDRIFNPILNDLLSKLGLIFESESTTENKKSFFDIFKN